MKTSYYLFIGISILLHACSTEKAPESNIHIDTKPHQLSIGTTSFSFGANSDLTKDVSVTAENTGWEFTNIPTSWLSVTPSSGSTSAAVKLTATENKSVDETRVHVMNFHSTDANYGYSRDISVSQAAATVYINPRETSYGCEAVANSKTIGIDSNVEWDATCSETWVTLTKGNGQLTISATENLGASRTATISLKRVGTTTTVSTISVAQSEANVTGSTETLQFDISAGSKTVPIIAGASWTAYTSDPSWISVTPEAGNNGNATLTISVTANVSSNTRSGFVYVKIGDNTKLSIPIQQEKLSIIIEGSSFVLEGYGTGSHQLNVVSNAPWTLTSKPEWLDVTPNSGNAGTTSITLTAEENPSSHFRQGNLVLGIPNTAVSTSILVEQSGIGVNEEDLFFAWNENKQTLSISATDSWSAMASEEWISLSQYSGAGPTNITVTVTTNDNEDERNGKITFILNGSTKEISVRQGGQYLKIGETAGLIPAMGGIVSIAVNTTVGAQGTLEYSGNVKDWVLINNETNNTYKLSIATNPSQYNRSAVFTIKPTQETTNQAATAGVKYSITQKGRIITTNVKRIEFFCQGGTSNLYTIQADGEYSIQKDSADTWYVIKHNTSTNVFSIVVSENTANQNREGKITLWLNNLPDGEKCEVEIPVLQFSKGLNIGISGFKDDENWNK